MEIFNSFHVQSTYAAKYHITCASNSDIFFSGSLDASRWHLAGIIRPKVRSGQVASIKDRQLL